MSRETERKEKIAALYICDNDVKEKCSKNNISNIINYVSASKHYCSSLFNDIQQENDGGPVINIVSIIRLSKCLSTCRRFVVRTCSHCLYKFYKPNKQTNKGVCSVRSVGGGAQG